MEIGEGGTSSPSGCDIKVRCTLSFLCWAEQWRKGDCLYQSIFELSPAVKSSQRKLKNQGEKRDDKGI